VSLFSKTWLRVRWHDQSEQEGHVTMVDEQGGVNLDQMLDLTTPWCLMVAATLRIPDLIAEGHRDIADLATAAGCDRDALHAVLGYLVSEGVFQQQAPGRFDCNRAAEQLADQRRFLDLESIGGRMAHTWGTLLDYVRTGRPAYQKLFGRPFWEDLAAHPKIAADFDALMGPAGHGMPDFDIELTAGWGAIRTLVDVGGGTGAMLASLLRRHPEVRGILVDFPGTVARASEISASAGVADRVTLHGQSFFDPLPAGADLYLLKSVLNDWSDEATVAILRRCAQAAETAQPAGRIAVLGGVAPDDEPRSLSIDMLVAGGKTSTVTDFTELARQAGLEILSAATQASGRFVVECRPAGVPASAVVECRLGAATTAAQQGSPMTQEDAEAVRARSLVHGQVCYLQVPAVDSTRSAAFYEAVFGWQTERPYQDFESPGLIGQWVEGRPPAPGAGPMFWIHVADLDETLERVVTHGGEIIDLPSPDGPTRTLATILDPEGNPIGLASHNTPLSSRRNASG
jgi:2,7-dihydroxy-5-methyl-1-naphthoate 7-O-methyltransferase